MSVGRWLRRAGTSCTNRLGTADNSRDSARRPVVRVAEAALVVCSGPINSSSDVRPAGDNCPGRRAALKRHRSRDARPYQSGATIAWIFGLSDRAAPGRSGQPLKRDNPAPPLGSFELIERLQRVALWNPRWTARRSPAWPRAIERLVDVPGLQLPRPPDRCARYPPAVHGGQGRCGAGFASHRGRVLPVAKPLIGSMSYCRSHPDGNGIVIVRSLATQNRTPGARRQPQRIGARRTLTTSAANALLEVCVYRSRVTGCRLATHPRCRAPAGSGGAPTSDCASAASLKELHQVADASTRIACRPR